MKTALQLTMHYVRNYGSALQTYALQSAIESVPGWRCLTLDVRPHWEQGGWSMSIPSDQSSIRTDGSMGCLKPSVLRRWKNMSVRSLVRKIKGAYRSRYIIRPWERMFDDFLAKEIHRTPDSYHNIKELEDNSPLADLYITGSDQTFNPRFTRGEDFWFWSFLSESQLRRSRKISYASSFASNALRNDYRDLYKRWLPTYQALSVRESSGIGIARELGLDAVHCCDPTLLLDRNQWRKFAAKSKRKINKPYILCYNLRYAVDPYPAAEKFERDISKKLGLPIIHLQEGPVQWTSTTGKIVRGVSLYDFVSLFLNASFIMTSSFHGTSFALQSGVPFLVYVNANEKVDGRALDLLRKCNAERHAVAITGAAAYIVDVDDFALRDTEQESLLLFRESSVAWLRDEMELVGYAG